MELSPIFEVVRIKQEIREMVEPFPAFQIRNPEDPRISRSANRKRGQGSFSCHDAQHEKSCCRSTPGACGKPECECRPS